MTVARGPATPHTPEHARGGACASPRSRPPHGWVASPSRRLMSATLQATGLAAGHGDRTLFSGLDLVVAPGDVVGLVGANGAGKSTLLRLLAGLAAPEAGTVTVVARRRAPVGYLPQEPERARGETVRGLPRPAHRRAAAPGGARRGGRRRSPTATPGADDAYADALERWLALGARRPRRARRQVVADLGLGVDLGPADDGAVRRAGRPRGPGLAAAVALRRLPARRADQRPRPRRARPARAVRRRAAGAGRSSSATTASSSPAR